MSVTDSPVTIGHHGGGHFSMHLIIDLLYFFCQTLFETWFQNRTLFGMHISITYRNMKVIVQSFRHLGTLHSLSNLTQCYVAFSITHDYLSGSIQKIYSTYISNVPSIRLIIDLLFFCQTLFEAWFQNRTLFGMHISITYTNIKVIVQSFKHLGTLYSLSNLTQCYVALCRIFHYPRLFIHAKNIQHIYL